MPERTSVLIVGVGSIGERHLRCFAATGRVELGLCEANPQLRQAVADRYQVARQDADFEQALAAGFDAVVICTPAHLHVGMARLAVRSGMHVLIEKPLGTTIEGVDELRQDIVSHKLTAAVAYTLRAHPALARMRDAIGSGRFGKPVQIVATTGQNFAFYRPAYREIYYARRASGGGAVQDALTHVINAGEWLVGPTKRVVADLDHKVLAGVEVEDTVHVLTRHAGDVQGSYSLNQHQAPNELSITVACERGTARFESHRNRWRWMTEPGGSWNDEPIEIDRDGLFVRQASAFLDAIETGGQVLCTFDEGAQTLRTCLAVLASAERQAWVAMNEEEAAHG